MPSSRGSSPPRAEPASLASPPLGSPRVYLCVSPWSSFICFLSLTFKSTNFFFFTFFFLIYFWRLITLQYCIGLVLSYTDMSPPRVHMCSPS